MKNKYLGLNAGTVSSSWSQSSGAFKKAASVNSRNIWKLFPRVCDLVLGNRINFSLRYKYTYKYIRIISVTTGLAIAGTKRIFLRITTKDLGESTMKLYGSQSPRLKRGLRAEEGREGVRRRIGSRLLWQRLCHLVRSASFSLAIRDFVESDRRVSCFLLASTAGM